MTDHRVTDRRQDVRRENERAVHYATQAVLAAALDWVEARDHALAEGVALLRLAAAVNIYNAASAALNKENTL